MKISVERFIHKLNKSVSKRLRRVFAGFGKTEILVLGDSHAAVFRNENMAIPGYWFNVKSVGGATISGLQNPNSVTHAMPIFERAIKRYKGRICITLLGEVDTGFVIWYRAKKHGLDIEEVLERTLSNYREFIESIPRPKHIIVIGAPLPTIRDGQDWGKIAKARKQVTASQLERTELTLRLNRRMESYSKDSGIMFINLDSESMGDDGLVKDRLRHKNGNNHHYDNDEYVRLLKPRLRKLVEQLSGCEGGN